jgi:hypothetical protein
VPKYQRPIEIVNVGPANVTNTSTNPNRNMATHAGNVVRPTNHHASVARAAARMDNPSAPVIVIASSPSRLLFVVVDSHLASVLLVNG